MCHPKRSRINVLKLVKSCSYLNSHTQPSAVPACIQRGNKAQCALALGVAHLLLNVPSLLYLSEG